MGRFEREVTGERIRDKIAASKKKGIWMGGVVPLGYRVEDRALHIFEDHAILIRRLFAGYLELGSVSALKCRLDAAGLIVPEPSMERVDAAAASRSAGATSTRSYPTRSTSGGSRTGGRPMMACIPRSWSRGPGTEHTSAHQRA